MAKISDLMDQKVIIVAENFKFWIFASENHIPRTTRFLLNCVGEWSYHSLLEVNLNPFIVYFWK